MSIMDSLTLTSTAKRIDTSPVGTARHKLLDALALQIEAATATIKGEVFIRRVGRWVEVNGTKERRDVPVRFRPWWWKDEAGTIHLHIHYGNRPLELKPGKAAITVGAMDNLLPTLEQIKRAVVAGELDKAMAEAIARRQRTLRKPTATKMHAKAPQ
ncbi:hypothetical protein J2848_004128 [Azospirillum lipoferum]|uniref:Uncharacterized protein n=1 Tax=Azospirillum lipoferum TaxID=193 RepID=A0A5A9GJP8_AZOLI|nr:MULTISPECIES: DUF6641 family protein [Azospirillum]KAA0593962.1 hypothetical protein FZ942_21220 [Azospirillum lipoferum]MCP1612437.1 hypothetical protein [Azospirillum lipoferum]MDW5531779.1 DUF6641 family protein [Azospirillum sp. NL1]